MPLLNLGWSEITFILVIGFILLGPDRITQTAKDLGKWLGKLKNNATFREVVKTTDEIRNYPRKIMDDVRFEDTILHDDLSVFDDRMREHPMRMSGSERPKNEPPPDKSTTKEEQRENQA